MTPTLAKSAPVRLGNYVKIRTGKLDANASSADGAYPFFTCSREPLRIASYSYDCECVLIAGNGDLNVKYYNGKFDAYQRTYILESVDPVALSVPYLFQFMSIYIDQLRSMTVGGVIQYIKLGFLTEAKIPLPPLAEQRRIAEVLDRAEALRAKRRAALAQLDSLTQSLFLDLFGDPITNPRAWPMTKLGTVAREKPNNGIFRKNPEYLQEGSDGLPVVWVEELFRGDSIDTKCSRRVIPMGTEVVKYGLKSGDLLFCRSSLKLDGIAFNNVYLGKDGAALFECHIIRISPDQRFASPIFLNCLLRLPQMRAIAKSKSKTATMTTIDQQGLCSIEFPLPPLDLQREFARRVAAVEKLKVSQRAALAELDALFAALQQRAFRGEL